jgi:hypothetical protein
VLPLQIQARIEQLRTTNTTIEAKVFHDDSSRSLRPCNSRLWQHGQVAGSIAKGIGRKRYTFTVSSTVQVWTKSVLGNALVIPDTII